MSESRVSGSKFTFEHVKARAGLACALARAPTTSTGGRARYAGAPGGFGDGRACARCRWPYTRAPPDASAMPAALSGEIALPNCSQPKRITTGRRIELHTECVTALTRASTSHESCRYAQKATPLSASPASRPPRNAAAKRALLAPGAAARARAWPATSAPAPAAARRPRRARAERGDERAEPERVDVQEEAVVVRRAEPLLDLLRARRAPRSTRCSARTRAGPTP